MAGLERFRVLHLVRTEPYAVGRIEAFPLEQARSLEVVRQVRRTGDLFVKYLRLVGEVLGTVIQIEQTPRDPSSLAYLIGIALQVPMEEKQELLSILSLPALLAREAHILSREEMLLQRMREFQHGNTGYVQGATGYLSLN
jgi:Lon protease-like protein